jgi:dephospho-CoA kinase
MGKSTAATILERRGAAICDTDVLARQVVEPGQHALKEIEQLFGPKVIGPEGALRRGAVAEIIFADSGKRRQLEAIVHPRIRLLWQSQVEAWHSEGRQLGVVVIPLLFETDAAADFQAIVCVACSAATQRQRLRSRGWTNEQIDSRIAAQWPIQNKMELSNFVVWTDASLAIHEAQLKRIVDTRL